MNPLKETIKKLMLAQMDSSARLQVVQSVIADVFRIHLGTETDGLDEVKSALGALANKLLAMQSSLLADQERTTTMLGDIQRAVNAAQAGQASEATDDGNGVPEKPESVPPVEATTE